MAGLHRERLEKGFKGGPGHESGDPETLRGSGQNVLCRDDLFRVWSPVPGESRFELHLSAGRPVAVHDA